MAEEGKKKFGMRDIFRVFWPEARPFWVSIIAILLLNAVIEVLSTGAVPLIFKRFTDVVVSATGDRSAVVSSLVMVIVLLAGVRLANIILGRIFAVINARFETRVMAQLEERAFRHTLGLSYKFFTDSFSGTLGKKISRLSSSFETLADLCLTDVWTLVVDMVTTVTILARIRPSVAGIMVAWCVFIVALNFWWVNRRKGVDEERAALDSQTGGLMSDALTNSINIKLFATEKREDGFFTSLTDKLYTVTARVWNLTSTADTLRGLLLICLEFGTFWIFINGWSHGTLTLGDFVLFQTAIVILNGRMYSMGRIIRQSVSATANAKEAIELMDTEPEVKDIPRAKALRVKQGNVVFSSVDFSYVGNQVLQGFSLDIAAREKIALVGPSGAGKSTVTKLLLRFYDVSKGAILVDGQDISRVTQSSLREAISLVPQEPILFHRSLRENIAYGRDGASEKEIIAAAKKAHCHEFISSLEKGYDTLVGERGIKLSGGERQRVAIARAILKDAPILILDEATSSLDSESESLIQDALRQLMKNKTVIVIAHRLSTIMQMDRIIVMEDGKVTDMGTHDELLKKVGIYQKLWNIQAGGFKQR
ncbi:MAG: ABC transporter ATP-binding protein [Patescibacteria group bacterium]